MISCLSGTFVIIKQSIAGVSGCEHGARTNTGRGLAIRPQAFKSIPKITLNGRIGKACPEGFWPPLKFKNIKTSLRAIRGYRCIGTHRVTSPPMNQDGRTNRWRHVQHTITTYSQVIEVNPCTLDISSYRKRRAPFPARASLGWLSNMPLNACSICRPSGRLDTIDTLVWTTDSPPRCNPLSSSTKLGEVRAPSRLFRLRHQTVLVLLGVRSVSFTSRNQRREWVRLTSKKSVAAINTMNPSASSSTHPSRPPFCDSTAPIPAFRFRVWVTSIRWSVRNLRPCAT